MSAPSFADKMTTILNHGAINLAMAVAYRTGLFDAMDRFDEPRGISAIAEAAALNERYVREWLGVMVTGDIIELVAGVGGEDRFFLPKTHGDFLTRRAGNANLGVYTQETPLLTTSALEAVVSGFHTGRGVGYESYPRFHAFMSELADAKHRQVLVQKFLPAVDDGTLVKQLEDGIRVCDLGCAEGVALLLMAGAFPRSEFVGLDISSRAIEEARTNARRLKVRNAEFRICDAAELRHDDDLGATIDYITAFDAIHDQTDPLGALQSAHHLLARGGLFSMVDIAAHSRLSDNTDHPMAPFLYTVSLMHCMPVGLVDDGAGLGMMWGRENAESMLGEAGFEKVEVTEIPDDPFNLHFLCRK